MHICNLPLQAAQSGALQLHCLPLLYHWLTLKILALLHLKVLLKSEKRVSCKQKVRFTEPG